MPKAKFSSKSHLSTANTSTCNQGRPCDGWPTVPTARSARETAPTREVPDDHQSGALVPIQPAFADAERRALAGFLAGYRGLTREA
jgi:hypothetical protein